MEEMPPMEPRTRVSRTEALDRMTKALETAKKARDAGRNVSEIRKSLKQARAAFEAGDYDTAAKLAEEILRDLEAAPLQR
jgi:ribosomal protein S20